MFLPNSPGRIYVVDLELVFTCRLFQEERPVWHNIDCNPLPKDYTEPKVEEDSFQPEKITMVTDIKSSPDFFERNMQHE